MLQDEILITKFLPVDGPAACAMVCEVTALARKSWNNSVKAEIFLADPCSPVFRARKFSTVFETLSAHSSRETQSKGSPSNGDVEEHGVHCGWARQLQGSGKFKTRMDGF